MAKTNFKIAARELPPRSFKDFNAALIISAYFGCVETWDDLALFVEVFFFFGDVETLFADGVDEATGALVVSVIFMSSIDGKF